MIGRTRSALLVGTAGIAVSVLMAPLTGTPIAFAGAWLAGAAAGWLAGRRGALVGLACAVIVALAWSAAVLLRAWLDGSLFLEFPACDPCGLTGHLGRMAIVAAIGLATFGLAAAFGGAVGAYLRGRRGR